MKALPQNFLTVLEAVNAHNFLLDLADQYSTRRTELEGMLPASAQSGMQAEPELNESELARLRPRMIQLDSFATILAAESPSNKRKAVDAFKLLTHYGKKKFGAKFPNLQISF